MRWGLLTGSVLVALFLGTALAESQETSPPTPEGEPIERGETQGAMEDQPDARQYYGDADETIAEQAEDEPAEPDARAHESQGRQQDMNGAQHGQQIAAYTYWLTVFTFVLAAATIILAVSALWQAAIARGAARRQLRAYLMVEVVKGIVLQPSRDWIRIQIKVSNNGQTPADHIRSISGTIILPYHPQDGRIKEPKLPSGTMGSQTIIGTGQDFAINSEIPCPNANDIRDMQRNDERYHIFGVVYYRDVFNREQKTRYCFFIKNEMLLDAVLSRSIPESPQDNFNIVYGFGFSRANQFNEIK